MGFRRVLSPRQHKGLQPGIASIQAAGYLVVPIPDLNTAGLCDFVAILVDPDTNRLALQAPKPVEAGIEIPSSKLQRQSRHNRKVIINKALAELGRDAPGCAGRYEIVHENGLLIIGLDFRLSP